MPANITPEVQAVFDDIKATRQTDIINNFWLALAHNPALLRQTWTQVKQTMAAPSTLPALVKEMIYVAVSVTNGCQYCTASHTAAAQKAGMTPEMFADLMAVVGLANQTNALANGLRVPLDQAIQAPLFPPE